MPKSLFKAGISHPSHSAGAPERSSIQMTSKSLWPLACTQCGEVHDAGSTQGPNSVPACPGLWAEGTHGAGREELTPASAVFNMEITALHYHSAEV